MDTLVREDRDTLLQVDILCHTCCNGQTVLHRCDVDTLVREDRDTSLQVDILCHTCCNGQTGLGRCEMGTFVREDFVVVVVLIYVPAVIYRGQHWGDAWCNG